MYKIPINKLEQAEKDRLFSVMGKTKKGCIQLSQYSKIDRMGLYSVGGCFMMSIEDYESYLIQVVTYPFLNRKLK